MNLENNSKELEGLIVETFIENDLAALIYDGEKLQQWNDKITELELEGQKKTLTKDKSPIPFMYLKTTMVNVFRTICPREDYVEIYDTTPIPLEILELVGLSKKEDYFSEVMIWYDEKSKDPACIGIVQDWGIDTSEGKRLKNLSFKNKEETLKYIKENEIPSAVPYKYWNNKYYLIGKWGDVKRPLSELRQMAINRWTVEQIDYYNKQIKDYSRKLEDIEVEARDKFGSV